MLLNNKKIVLLILVVLAIVAGAWFIFRYLKPLPEEKPFPINIEEIEFPTSVWGNRMLRNIERVKQEADRRVQLEIYHDIFADLIALYDRDRKSSLRKQAEDLTRFLEQEYPEYYNPQNFFIPCLDPECGTANYPEQISAIKSRLVEAENVMEPLVYNSIVNKFEAAAFSADPQFQWQQYLGAFQELRMEANRTGDETLKGLASELKNFLFNQYPEEYNRLEQLEPSSFVL